MFTLLSLKDISLILSSKTCFEAFSVDVHAGDKIAVIGRNGAGKSCLLKLINGELSPSSGSLTACDNLHIGYVEQTVTSDKHLSGGERLNKSLSNALAHSPELLLLDEPTNHLDKSNRKSLTRMLKHYPGTLIIATHDLSLIRDCNIIWHVHDNQISVHEGHYDDYMTALYSKQSKIENQIKSLKDERKALHQSLMQEQQRAAKSRAKGKKSIKQNKWPTVKSPTKVDRGLTTTGKKKASIQTKQAELSLELSELHLPEVILPTFTLSTQDVSMKGIVSITDASIGYNKTSSILHSINLSVTGKERIALIGDNASGKSTFLQALLDNQAVYKTGQWQLPLQEKIGYLDQHYSTLHPELSVLEHLSQIRPDWQHKDIRQHLMTFLFRTNEEVACLAKHLSGGEKARLSLSLIAAKPPRLLILDEITNNLDLETKQHVLQVLQAYPGALLIVSHEEEFLNALDIDQYYEAKNGQLERIAAY